MLVNYSASHSNGQRDTPETATASKASGQEWEPSVFKLHADDLLHRASSIYAAWTGMCRLATGIGICRLATGMQ